MIVPQSKLRLHGHVLTGYNYARDVVDGRIIACKWVKLACQRQLDDLKRWETSGPYRFDIDKANEQCRFMEELPHVKGRWARNNEKIVLEPWMCFIHTAVFGWVHRDTGLRRFRAVYEEMARKNAKSTRLAGTGLYMLAADGEAGPEIYSAATTRDQAKIVFHKIAKPMVRKSPEMQADLDVEVFAHAITHIPSGGTFQALSADSHTLEGLNPSFSAIDELHAHKTRGVYDVLESATLAREQAIVWTITTAGTDRSGICYEVRSYITKILQGVIKDETYFGIIYTIDDEDQDNWLDESLWIKANPNLGVSVDLDNLRRLARKAAETPAAQANFLTKHLCVWVSADMAWMDMAKWDKCGKPGIDIEDYVHQDCYIGVDLASRVDLAAMAILFVEQRTIDGKSRPLYTLFGRYWLPEETIQSSGNAQYQGWARSGIITETPGPRIEFADIEDELLGYCSLLNVREVPYDGWNAEQFAQRMLKKRVPMIELGQNTKTFSEPMKEFQALVLAGDIQHANDSCFTWQVSNVVAHIDRNDNIYPRKELPQNKIDIIFAALMALARAMLSDKRPSVYEGRGIRVLGE